MVRGPGNVQAPTDKQVLSLKLEAPDFDSFLISIIQWLPNLSLTFFPIRLKSFNEINERQCTGYTAIFWYAFLFLLRFCFLLTRTEQVDAFEIHWADYVAPKTKRENKKNVVKSKKASFKTENGKIVL